MLNALSIDVEDYYQVSVFDSKIRFDQWSGFESRVFGNTVRILEILDYFNVKATFFILGWIAREQPKVIREIVEAGHEIACHSYNHRLVYTLTQNEFREDVHRTKGILEDLAGVSVVGYRAPSYSIIQSSLWALDILMEEGMIYDSSIFPIRHDRYGLPKFPRHPYWIQKKGNRILEFPPSTLKLGPVNFPIAGGGYFRLLPYFFLRWGIRRLNRFEKEPAVVYIHPWELDYNQPRINKGILSNPRHYINLGRTEVILKRLLKDFSFVSFRTLYELFKHKLERVKDLN